MVSPKFKKGDKVRLVKEIYYKTKDGSSARPGIREGNVYTIETDPTYYRSLRNYVYDAAETIYLLVEDELELVEPEYMTVTFEVKAGNKKAAHKVAHEAVEAAYAAWETPKEPVYENWTEEEIRKAQDAIAKLVHYVVMNGGDISWSKDNRGNIWCRHRRDLYAPFNQANKGMAKKMSEDTYNEWIGKCVSLYHAMDIQLPEFIRFKNVKR